MKCKSEINAIMLKELNAKMKILYLIFLIIGSVGVGTYIVLAVIFDSVPELDYLLYFSSAYLNCALSDYKKEYKKTTCGK